MKKLVYLVIALCVAFVFSCTESEDSGNISISGNKSISSSSEGGDFKVSFTAVDAWYASVTRVTKSDTLDWISISPDSGMAGECTVDVSVSPNNDSESRKAGIVISCAGETVTVTVTQKGSSDDEGNVVPDTTSYYLPKRIFIRSQYADGKLEEEEILLKYANNKLAYMERKLDGSELNYVKKISFDYNDNKAVVINEHAELYYQNEEYSFDYRNAFLLNSQGMIDCREDTPDRKFYYNNDNLIKYYKKDGYNHSSPDFTWENGNLILHVLESQKYLYSQYLNDKIVTLDINWLLADGYNTSDLAGDSNIQITGFAGLLGKRSVNIVIPKKIKYRYDNTADYDIPEYLLASDNGKEVRIRTERFYSGDDFTFYCEYGDGGRLTFLRGESEAFKEVYEEVDKYEINFDGRKEVVNGETRYYDFYSSEVTFETISEGENVGKRFYEMSLEY